MTMPAVLALCSEDIEAPAEDPAERSPFWRALDSGADSAFQHRMRGGPRAGEDWQTQGLLDTHNDLQNRLT
jgi:hypothetical protein